VKVIKFGGTSVGTEGSIKAATDIILQYHYNGQKLAVVASAVSGITNTLINTAQLAAQSNEGYQQMLQEIEHKHINLARALLEPKNQSKALAQLKGLLNELEDLLNGVYLLKELSLRTLDLVQSFGERMSCALLSECLLQQGINAHYLDARQLIRTDGHFGSAAVDYATTNSLITDYFDRHQELQIITGFIGSTAKGETTTLGRGGSDYTAAIVAAALNATEIEIWTDVDGMMTADPRKVRKAFTLPAISYVEAMEMSHFGAKVIYPPTLQPAFSKKIPIRIRNTFNRHFEGTLISEFSGSNDYLIKGLSSIDEVALISLEGSGLVGVAGVAARLFNTLAQHQINIILITQASSEHSITFAVLPQYESLVKEVVEAEFAFEIQQGKVDPLSINNDCSIVAIIGENMRRTVGVSARLFEALGRNGISVSATAQGSSELNISIVIDRSDLSKALNALHQSFFLSHTKTLNLFLVGPGLVGDTLLRQIKQQAAYLEEQLSLKIKLIGLANTRYMLFDEDGIDLGCGKDILTEKGEPSNLAGFSSRIKALNLPNSIYVDCTASKDTVQYYIPLLEANISVVTPNKYANSGRYTDYQSLHQAASRYGVNFCYETNVGAGLPVISALKDLMNSGDKILKIEAVLSGSVSFISNTFKEGIRFSEVVMQAKEKGYTEPDPREDLSGADVARKILILARETGLALEPEEVEVKSFLPDECMNAASVEAFFAELKKADHVFEEQRQQAEAAGKVLRFVASLEQGKALVSLQQVDKSHPFYTLSGSDNMISYTTERYRERPLVVKGPGAGAEVTAAGIFAEIIKCSG
jgi:aspartokinase/homoserine dehydrogenase 1